MSKYTVGDYLGQDSTEYLVYQILQKIQAVCEGIDGKSFGENVIREAHIDKEF